MGVGNQRRFTLSSIRLAMAGLRHGYFSEVYVHSLRAFIDDSGSGGDSPWFVLAGYVGTCEAWDAFDEPWLAALKEPPRLKYFKSSEAESLKFEFAGFTKEQRNQRIDSLIEVIGKHALRAMYVRVKQQDYNEVIKPYIPERWDNAYYFLFTGIIAASTTAEKYAGTSRPIEFFFDNANRLKAPSRKLYGQVSDLPQFGNRVIDIHYEDEKEFLPLQAADLLAWQIRRRFSVEESPRPQFESALNCPPQPPFPHTITREELESMGEAMEVTAKREWAQMGYREGMRPWKRPPKQ